MLNQATRVLVSSAQGKPIRQACVGVGSEGEMQWDGGKATRAGKACRQAHAHQHSQHTAHASHVCEHARTVEVTHLLLARLQLQHLCIDFPNLALNLQHTHMHT